MNRNRIIKVILGVLMVLLVVWFCVLSYQDGYARDYGIYRSRTLLLMAVVLLLCCVVLFFYGSFFCKKGIGKVQICNFVFLILTVASLGLWGNSAAVKDEDAEAKAVLEDYIKEEMDGKVLFLNLTEVPRSFYQNPSADAPYYDAQDYDWTFLLGLLGVWLMEQVRKKGKTWMYLLVCVLVVLAGLVLGTLCMVDYYGVGVLTVFVFYFLHGRKWWCFLGQLAALYWLNVELLGGLMYPVQLFGMEFELCQQGLALLALIPIWLYHGRQGYHSKPFQYLCYAFYPVHMLLLVVVLNFINR